MSLGSNSVQRSSTSFDLEKKRCPPNVEMEVLVAGGARDAADVLRVGFKDRDRDALLGQQVGSGQSRRTGADDRY
jgi:hypothetical protein